VEGRGLQGRSKRSEAKSYVYESTSWETAGHRFVGAGRCMQLTFSKVGWWRFGSAWFVRASVVGVP